MSSILHLTCEYKSTVRNGDGATASRHVRSCSIRLNRPNGAEVLTSMSLFDPKIGRWERRDRWEWVHVNSRTYLRERGGERTTRPATAADPEGALKLISPLQGFYDTTQSLRSRIAFLQQHRLISEFRRLAPERRDGVRCDVFQLRYRQIGTPDYKLERFSIGPGGLVRHGRYEYPAKKQIATYQLTKVRINDL